MKILNLIKKIIIWAFTMAFLGFVILMAILLLNYNKYGVTQFDKTTLVIIKHKITSERYQVGDLVLVKAKELKELKAGEEVFTYHVADDGKVNINVGKIDKLHLDEEAFTYVNGETYSDKFLIGTGDKVYPEVGRYLSIIQSQWGFFFILLVPTFFIFVSQIYALIVEIKYGDHEENDKDEEEKSSN